MVALTRPVALYDLVIPTEQPSHGAVEKVATPPRPPQPKGSREARFSAITRQPSFSHLSRVRDLRAASSATTPTLSPLMLNSPKVVVKKSQAPVGHARAYAAFVRSSSKSALAVPLQAAAPIRVVKISGSTYGGGIRTSSGLSTPGYHLRARPHVPGGRAAPPRAHRPLSRTTAAAHNCLGTYSAVAVGGTWR